MLAHKYYPHKTYFKTYNTPEITAVLLQSDARPKVSGNNIFTLHFPCILLRKSSVWALTLQPCKNPQSRAHELQARRDGKSVSSCMKSRRNASNVELSVLRSFWYTRALFQIADADAGRSKVMNYLQFWKLCSGCGLSDFIRWIFMNFWVIYKLRNRNSKFTV